MRLFLDGIAKSITAGRYFKPGGGSVDITEAWVYVADVWRKVWPPAAPTGVLYPSETLFPSETLYPTAGV